MKDWERHANDALRTLGEAYQQGRIGRDTYRERRRRLIESFHNRQEVTARREPPAMSDAAPTRERDAMPLLLGSHWVSAARWGLLVVLLIALAAVTLVLLWGSATNG